MQLTLRRRRPRPSAASSPSGSTPTRPTEAETTERLALERRRPGVGPAVAAHACSTPAGSSPGNPPEYGGRNATLIEQFVHLEELGRRGIHASFNPQGLGIVVPSILDLRHRRAEAHVGRARSCGPR